MYILGGIDDQITIHVWSRIPEANKEHLLNFEPYSMLFRPIEEPLTSAEPISLLSIKYLSDIFGPNSLWIISIAITILNVLFAYRLFKGHKHAGHFALIFAFSAYFWSRLGIHIMLMNTWLIALAFRPLITRNTFDTKNSIKIALIIFVTTLVSNYLGHVLIITFVAYYTATAIVNIVAKLTHRKYQVSPVHVVKSGIIICGISVLLLGTLLLPHLKAQYLNPDTTRSQSVYTALNRPYEDFFIFSLRPWYFFIPPERSPILGGISDTINAKLKETNYFLADDYFANEHQGAYLGMFFLLAVAITTAITLKYKNSEERQTLLILFLTLILILLVALPPFFTISGIKIYTLGELNYRIFPMFRSTSRLITPIHLILLIILAGNMQQLHQHLKKEHLSRFNVAMALLFCVIITTTFAPPKVSHVESPPTVFRTLEQEFPPESIIVAYPYSSAEEALFWLPVHNKYLLNPKYYKKGDFDAEQFTKRLEGPSVLTELEKYNVDIVVVNKKKISGANEADTVMFLKEILEISYEDNEFMLLQNHNKSSL